MAAPTDALALAATTVAQASRLASKLYFVPMVLEYNLYGYCIYQYNYSVRRN